MLNVGIGGEAESSGISGIAEAATKGTYHRQVSGQVLAI